VGIGFIRTADSAFGENYPLLVLIESQDERFSNLVAEFF